jgi:hypothetical protein
MKRLVVALTLLALAGCIPIGFKAQTQMIAPPLASHRSLGSESNSTSMLRSFSAATEFDSDPNGRQT